MTIRDYRDLKIWQTAMGLAEQVYLLSAQFPKPELYSLTAQVQRSAVSVPSNIAEGHARRSPAEFLRFLAIASGSLAELETQITLAHRFGYIPGKQLEEVLGKVSEMGKMLHGMQRSVKARRNID